MLFPEVGMTGGEADTPGAGSEDVTALLRAFEA